MNSMRTLIEHSALSLDLASIEFSGWRFQKYSDRSPTASVKVYFAESVPTTSLNFGNFNLLSTVDLDFHNSELIPSCCIAPHGFITIACTQSGDCYSVDISTGIVYLISHDKFEGDSIQPGWNSDYTAFLPALPITRENIISIADDEIPDLETALEFLVSSNTG